MTGWIALSDHDETVLAAAPSGVPPHAVLVFDLALPLIGTTVLLDHAGPGGALSLIYDPAAGFGVMLRQDGGSSCHMLPGINADKPGCGQLQFGWTTASGDWTLRFVTALGDDGVAASGRAPLPLPQRLLHDVCRGGPGQQRAAALLWCGATTGPAPAPAAWIGPRTPVATPDGPQAAGMLQPGDRVLTRDHGTLPVRAVRRQALPGQGSFAPVRLRAPFFHAPTDLLVSACQQIAISGDDVEYLFGCDTVLVAARHLVDGARALTEGQPRLLPWIALDLDHPALILSGTCALATGAAGSPSLRCLDRFEACTLQAMRRRGATRTAA